MLWVREFEPSLFEPGMYFNIKCMGKLPGLTNEFEGSLVFETGEFERPKFDCIQIQLRNLSKTPKLLQIHLTHFWLPDSHLPMLLQIQFQLSWGQTSELLKLYSYNFLEARHKSFISYSYHLLWYKSQFLQARPISCWRYSSHFLNARPIICCPSSWRPNP